jgi:hypothetical protein
MIPVKIYMLFWVYNKMSKSKLPNAHLYVVRHNAENQVVQHTDCQRSTYGSCQSDILSNLYVVQLRIMPYKS